MAHRKHDDAERARPVGGDRSVGSRHVITDAIGDEPGGHPLGTGVGAAGGAVTGTALGGAIGGPGAAVIGSAIGAVGGGLAGRSTAVVNPTEEEAYWRDAFLRRPYADETLGYDHYRPAYRYGWESRARFPDRRWDQVERELETGWREHRGNSRLGWTDAKLAARDAWQRVDRRLLDERERERVLDQRIALDEPSHGTAHAADREPASTR